MSASHDCGADAAAYVLGALEPAEVDSFRRHLQTCVVCQDEVESLEGLTSSLPMAAPQHQVSRELRSRVLAEVKEDARARQVTARAEQRKARSSSRSFGSLFGLSRPALGAAMALGLVVIAFVAVQLNSNGSSSPGTSIWAASVGDAQVKVTDGHGELIVHKLTQPKQGKIYEVWLKKAGSNPQPTKALFSVTSNGDGDVDIPGSLKGVKSILVTQQPADQTQVPVGKPVIVTNVS